MATLMSASELHQRLETGRRTVLLDVRWILGRTDGHLEYLAPIFRAPFSWTCPQSWPTTHRPGWAATRCQPRTAFGSRLESGGD